MKSSQKKLIIQLSISAIMLIVVGILLYNNFIKKDEDYFYGDEEMMFEEMALEGMVFEESIDVKFNLDIFENEIFKSLIKSEQVSTSTISQDQIGRENPFLPF